MVLVPRDFLELANQLYDDKHYRTEPGWRTVISRAYYASFLASMKKMQEMGASFQEADRIHRDVIEKLKDKNPQAANHLDTLREKRVESDYHLRANIRWGDCMNWLKLAERILIEVAELK